jgi:hypothetical protein
MQLTMWLFGFWPVATDVKSANVQRWHQERRRERWIPERGGGGVPPLRTWHGVHIHLARKEMPLKVRIYDDERRILKTISR